MFWSINKDITISIFCRFKFFFNPSIKNISISAYLSNISNKVIIDNITIKIAFNITRVKFSFRIYIRFNSLSYITKHFISSTKIFSVKFRKFFLYIFGISNTSHLSLLIISKSSSVFSLYFSVLKISIFLFSKTLFGSTINCTKITNKFINIIITMSSYCLIITFDIIINSQFIHTWEVCLIQFFKLTNYIIKLSSISLSNRRLKITTTSTLNS